MPTKLQYTYASRFQSHGHGRGVAVSDELGNACGQASNNNDNSGGDCSGNIGKQSGAGRGPP